MFLRNIITKIGDGMIYKNLSIAAGGGIIDHSQQAEQEDCANIFIGLGGTGIDCLKAVKCEVYNRLTKGQFRMVLYINKAPIIRIIMIICSD